MNPIANIPILNFFAGLPYKIPITMIKLIGNNVIIDWREQAMELPSGDKTDLLFFREGTKKGKPADKDASLMVNQFGKIVRGYVFFKAADGEYYNIPSTDLTDKNCLKNILMPIGEDTKARIALKLREKVIKYKEESKLKQIGQIIVGLSLIISIIAIIVFWSYIFPMAAQAGIDAASRIAEIGTVTCVCPPQMPP